MGITDFEGSIDFIVPSKSGRSVFPKCGHLRIKSKGSFDGRIVRGNKPIDVGMARWTPRDHGQSDRESEYA